MKQIICWGAPLFLFFVPLTVSYAIYYLFQFSVLQMVSGLRTNHGSANYQEGNGFLNNVCVEIGGRLRSGPGEGAKRCLRVAGGNLTVPLETNTISY